MAMEQKQQLQMQTDDNQKTKQCVQGDTTLTKVFVGGLAWETQSDTMRLYFQQFGEILEAVVITDKNTGRSKGYGFVTFRDAEAAQKACLDAAPIIDGRRANCNLASLGLAARPRSPFLQGNFLRPGSMSCQIPFAALTLPPGSTYNNSWQAGNQAHLGSSAILYQQPFLAYPPFCHYGYPSYPIDYNCQQYNGAPLYPGQLPQFYATQATAAYTPPLPAYSSLRPSSYGVQAGGIQLMQMQPHYHPQATTSAASPARVSMTSLQQYPLHQGQLQLPIPTMVNSSGLALDQSGVRLGQLIPSPAAAAATPTAALPQLMFPVAQTEQTVS